MVNIKKISTEKRNPNTKDIDLLSTSEIVKALVNEDKIVPLAVERANLQITNLINEVVKSLKNGGRLIYIGAGTSGRLGVLDASECPATFGSPPEQVIGIIAGGNEALTKTVTNVEDDKELAINDLKENKLTNNDFLIGIAASGRTPYTISALEYANKIGAKTGCITTSSNSVIAKTAKFPIEAITGPEAITGSTRLKSGTAQKNVLNIISTATMIKLGKVYENLMINVNLSNEKLKSRAVSIIVDLTGCSVECANEKLDKYNSVKYTIFSVLSGIEDINIIETILNENYGNIRNALKQVLK